METIQIQIASRPSDVRSEMSYDQWTYIQDLARKADGDVLQGLFKGSSQSYIIKRTSKKVASEIIDALKRGYIVELT